MRTTSTDLPMSDPMSSPELFPPVERVYYETAPLFEVVCQLRYPSILRIEKTPDDFQELVRGQFPLFERATNPQLSQLPSEVVEILGQQANPTRYLFITEDRSTTLSLTPDALALVTTKYSRWENFRSQLNIGLKALTEVYKPSFYNRVGLRYRNAIDRAALDLHTRPWSDLLIPEVLGVLAESRFEQGIEEARYQIRSQLPDGSGSVFLQHGLGANGHGASVYVIDLDFYTDKKTEIGNVDQILDHFHRRASWGFRWSITDVLHSALKPRPLPDDADI